MQRLVHNWACVLSPRAFLVQIWNPAGFKSGIRLAFVWSLPVWVLFGYSGFLPLSKNVHVRLTGGCDEMSAGVNVSLNDSLPVL